MASVALSSMCIGDAMRRLVQQMLVPGEGLIASLATHRVAGTNLGALLPGEGPGA